MLPITETRRLRLLQIMQERSLTPAELSDRLGRPRTDGTLNQIINRYKQSKTGTVRGMGANQARRIEQVLGLPVGWMDSPTDTNTSLKAQENTATYQAWPAAGMSLEQLHAALTPEQRGEVSGMIRAFLSMNAREQAQQTSQAHLPAPQSTLLTGT